MRASLRSGRPERRQGLWLRQVRSENAVVDPTTGSVHLLNETALAIWHLCDGQTDPEEMVAAVCDISALHPDVVTEDVARILSEFEQAGILQWVHA